MGGLSQRDKKSLYMSRSSSSSALQKYLTTNFAKGERYRLASFMYGTLRRLTKPSQPGFRCLWFSGIFAFHLASIAFQPSNLINFSIQNQNHTTIFLKSTEIVIIISINLIVSSSIQEASSGHTLSFCWEEVAGNHHQYPHTAVYT